jgi:hypothetical protein
MDARPGRRVRINVTVRMDGTWHGRFANRPYIVHPYENRPGANDPYSHCAYTKGSHANRTYHFLCTSTNVPT